MRAYNDMELDEPKVLPLKEGDVIFRSVFCTNGCLCEVPLKVEYIARGKFKILEKYQCPICGMFPEYAEQERDKSGVSRDR